MKTQKKDDDEINVWDTVMSKERTKKVIEWHINQMNITQYCKGE